MLHLGLEGITEVDTDPEGTFVSFNPIQDGLFLGCSRMGGGPFWSPSLKSTAHRTYPTMMKLGSYTLPKEDPKNV